MLEQQGQNDMQTRLNKMKAIDFYEQLQSKMIKRVFSQLKNNWTTKLLKYRSYYHMILYIKSFKGIMEYGLLQKDEKKQESIQVDQKKFRKNDDNCEKQFSSEMIRLRIFILKGRFQKFTSSINKDRREKQIKLKKALQILQKEKKGQEQARKREQQWNIKAKTQQAFNRRPLISQKESDLKYMTSMGENSRREYSPIAITSRQINASRRKYVPIKVLPPKPTNIPQIYSNTEINREKSIQQSIIKPVQSIQIQQNKLVAKLQQSKQNSHFSKTFQNSPKKIISTKQQQKSESFLHQRNAKIRQDTLAILSELKMIEIISLNQIIDDYSQMFKRQSFLNEKNYIKQSMKILERLKLIQ